MNGSLLPAEIDLIEDSPCLGLAAFGLLFGISFLVAVLGGGKRVNQSALQFILAQLIFVPLATWATLWCYQHPERLAATPDAWQYDLRIYWPFLAIFDAIVITWFIRSRWSWSARALRLLERANRLLAEGRFEEAEAAYAEGRWILDRQCKRH